MHVVLLVYPWSAKAKGITLLSVVDGCSPSSLRTSGIGIQAWHHANPTMWLLEQNQFMSGQESTEAAKMQLPVPLSVQLGT